MNHLSVVCLRLLYLCAAVSLATWTYASGGSLKPNLKYGKPSEEELALKVYGPDSSAVAVCLFHLGETEYEYEDGFSLVTKHQVRIKILKPQGVSWGNVEIPFYAPADQDKGQERASDVEGCSYNLENGKTVKAKLKRSMVSEERVNQYYKVVKFSLPSVKEGTVIEYSYQIHSDYFSQIDNWLMQQEIPVVFNRYKISIPDVFVYNIEFRGRDKISIKEGKGDMRATWNVVSGMSSVAKNFTISTRELEFTSENLPGLRQDEPFCWNPEDYRIQISFDLQGTNFPDEGYRAYSQNWASVDKQLKEDERFGQLLSLRNPFRDAIPELNAASLDFEEKVVAAFGLLKSRLAWNGEYRLLCEDMDKVLETQAGSNADLNFILMRILQDLGIKAYPVVLSRRSLGMLPVSFPSIQKLNTFVVALYNAQQKRYYFLDSSMPFPALNVLPLELLVNRARILFTTDAEKDKWVNLLNLSENTLNMSIDATMKGETVEGHRRVKLSGQKAAEYLNGRLKGDTLCWRAAADALEGVEIRNLKMDVDEKNLSNVSEELDFKLKASQAGDRIYVNPMLFLLQGENPFIQTERVLPVEFPYPYRLSLIGLLKLPEGYEVEEIPESSAIKTEDGKLQCKYLLQRTGNSVSLKYTFDLDTSIIPGHYYKQLQEIMNRAVELNHSLIVLKKQAAE